MKDLTQGTNYVFKETREGLTHYLVEVFVSEKKDNCLYPSMFQHRLSEEIHGISSLC